MEEPVKNEESLLSFDQEKLVHEKENRRKQKPSQEFLTWENRRSSIQSYMCLTLNFMNMIQFSTAIIIHGGIVWITYIIWAVIIGLPMIAAELTLGHYVNNEIKYVWQMCRIGTGVFWNCLLSTFVTATLCHVYLTILLFLSIQPDTLQVKYFSEFDRTDPNCSTTEVSYEYLYNETSDICVDHQDSGLLGALNEKYLHLSVSEIWNPSLYLAAVCFLMILITCRGIRSLERVTILLFLVPYTCGVILALLIFTLPGAINYLQQRWYLHWRKLNDFSVWLVSFKTIITLFSIGNLGLIFVSVHSDYRDDIMIDIVILLLNVFLNTVLQTITFLGLIGLIDNKSKEVPRNMNYNDYVFILVKAAQGLTELPPPHWLWEFLFYSYLIGSAFAQQTFMVAAVSDVIVSLVPIFKTNRFYVTACICIAFAALGIVIFAVEDLRMPSIDSSFVTVGFLQSITVFWIYNYDRIYSDFHFLMGYKPSLFYQITWVLSPITFLSMILTSLVLMEDLDLLVNNTLYLTLLHIFIYVLCAVIEFYKSWRKKENLNICKANEAWGPNDPLLKESRIIFMSRVITKEHIYRQKLYEEQLVKPNDITNQNIVQVL